MLLNGENSEKNNYYSNYKEPFINKDYKNVYLNILYNYFIEKATIHNDEFSLYFIVINKNNLQQIYLDVIYAYIK